MHQRYCTKCGQMEPSGSLFCGRCGTRVALAQTPGTPAYVNRRVSSQKTRIRALGRWLAVVVVLTGLAATVIIGRWQSDSGAHQKAAVQPRSDQAEKKASTGVSRPTIAPPKFQLYRSKLDEHLTSIVVSPDATDGQLRSLLWLFREKVRSHRFKDIGITDPSSYKGDQRVYLGGSICVYRGQKCAGEGFLGSVLNPCGQGEHAAAEYEWGWVADNDPKLSNTEPDVAWINTSSDGYNSTEVFNSAKDHWQLPPEP